MSRAVRARWPAYVLLNPGAGGGRARARWGQVQGALDRALDIQRVFELPAAEGGWDAGYREMLAEQIRIAFGRGRRLFVAAGGDGTVQILAGAMLDALGPGEREGALLGAVGLGSSNDFHRPWRTEDTAGGCPLRLDHRRARPRDIGEVRYGDGGGTDDPREREETRHFVVSASLGVVSQGNRLFNEAAGPLRWLKSFWTGGAITAAALTAVIRYRPIEVEHRLGDELFRRQALTHMGIMKSPYLAGGMNYGFEVPDADGQLDIALVGPMRLPRRLYTLAALSRGRFQGLKGTVHRRSPTLEVRSPGPIQLELDGETVEGIAFRFRALKGAVRVCAPGPPPPR